MPRANVRKFFLPVPCKRPQFFSARTVQTPEIPAPAFRTDLLYAFFRPHHLLLRDPRQEMFGKIPSVQFAVAVRGREKRLDEPDALPKSTFKQFVRVVVRGDLRRGGIKPFFALRIEKSLIKILAMKQKGKYMTDVQQFFRGIDRLSAAFARIEKEALISDIPFDRPQKRFFFKRRFSLPCRHGIRKRLIHRRKRQFFVTQRKTILCDFYAFVFLDEIGRSDAVRR